MVRRMVESNRTGCMVRRDALCGGLRSIGWNVPDAQGTMFVWAKIPERFASSVDFAIELMEKRPALSWFRAAPSVHRARATSAWRLSFRPSAWQRRFAALTRAVL